MLHSLNPKAMWHTAELMWESCRGESRLTTAPAGDDRDGDLSGAQLSILNRAHAEFLLKRV